MLQGFFSSKFWPGGGRQIAAKADAAEAADVKLGVTKSTEGATAATELTASQIMEPFSLSLSCCFFLSLLTLSSY